MTESEPFYGLFFLCVSMAKTGRCELTLPGFVDLIRDIARKYGFAMGQVRERRREDTIVSDEPRAVFDLESDKILLDDCDMSARVGTIGTVLDLSLNQDAVLEAGLFQADADSGLLLEITRAMFQAGRFQTGIVEFEEILTLFYPEPSFDPGEWNLFENSVIPDFLQGVEPWLRDAYGVIYRKEQFVALSEEQMGIAVRRAMGISGQGLEDDSGCQSVE